MPCKLCGSDKIDPKSRFYGKNYCCTVHRTVDNSAYYPGFPSILMLLGAVFHKYNPTLLVYSWITIYQTLYLFGIVSFLHWVFAMLDYNYSTESEN